MTQHIDGMDILIAQLGRLEKVPKKYVTKAAKAGAKPILSEAKNGTRILVDTGLMKSSLHLKGERNRPKAKKVYQIAFKANPAFVKVTKDGKRYFYPASQEYGYQLRNGGYMPGAKFMQSALQDNIALSEKIMVDTMIRGIREGLGSGVLRER